MHFELGCTGKPYLTLTLIQHSLVCDDGIQDVLVALATQAESPICLPFRSPGICDALHCNIGFDLDQLDGIRPCDLSQSVQDLLCRDLDARQCAGAGMRRVFVT